jgi:hypothetical protein
MAYGGKSDRFIYSRLLGDLILPELVGCAFDRCDAAGLCSFFFQPRRVRSMLECWGTPFSQADQSSGPKASFATSRSTV